VSAVGIATTVEVMADARAKMVKRMLENLGVRGDDYVEDMKGISGHCIRTTRRVDVPV
jgi:hypothetical protein